MPRKESFVLTHFPLRQAILRSRASLIHNIHDRNTPPKDDLAESVQLKHCANKRRCLQLMLFDGDPLLRELGLFFYAPGSGSDKRDCWIFRTTSSDRLFQRPCNAAGVRLIRSSQCQLENCESVRLYQIRTYRTFLLVLPIVYQSQELAVR